MSIKDQIRADIWQLLFALIVPSIILSLPYISSPFSSYAISLAVIAHYVPIALITYIYANIKGIKNYPFYAISGVVLGALVTFFMAMTLFFIRPPEPLDFSFLVSVFLAKIGAFLGFFFNSFFWAFVVSKEVKHKIIYSVTFVIFVFLPSLILAKNLIENPP